MQLRNQFHRCIAASRQATLPSTLSSIAQPTNPLYDPAREDQDSLLRGLFTTSWLVEDFLDVNDHFGAVDCLITSASSKTSIALGHSVQKRGRLVGGWHHLPTESGLSVEQLGCYDTVVTYDDMSPGLDCVPGRRAR